MGARFEAVQASFGRCLRERGFISHFYSVLLDSSDEIRGMFETTDWPKQQRALRRGISVALTYAGGSGIVSRPMDDMARVHSRKGRVPVKPELYQLWIEAILSAVREFDPQLTPALEQQWRAALDVATRRFIELY